MAFFSSPFQTCSGTVLLDIGWVKSQVATAATAVVVIVVVVIVLAVVVLIIVVLTVVILAIVVVLLLALTLTTLALTALPESSSAKASSTKASKLGIGYTRCYQDREKCRDPHDDRCRSRERIGTGRD